MRVTSGASCRAAYWSDSQPNRAGNSPAEVIAAPLIVAGPGDVIVINPDEAYSVEAAMEDGWTFRAFYPRSDDVGDAASQALKRRLAAPMFGAR